MTEQYDWSAVKVDKPKESGDFDWSAVPVSSAPAAEPKPEGFTGRFSAGFKRSLPETKSLLVGAGAAVAGAVGADDTANTLLDKYREIDQNEVKPLASDTSFTDVVAGDGKLSEWAGDTLGNFAGQALQSVAAAGAGAAVGSALPGAGTVGGAIGGVVAKQGVKKLVSKKVAEMVAEKAATTAGKKKLAGMAAGTALATGMNVGQEVGIGYTGRAEDAAAAGEAMTKADGLRAIGWGVPAGLLDTVAEAFAAKNLFKGASANPSFIKRMLAGMAKGAAVEGGTEGAQAFLERMGADQDVATKEAFLDYVNNAAAGALGGGVAGTTSGFKRQQQEQSGQGGVGGLNSSNTQPPPTGTSNIDPTAGPISAVAAAADGAPGLDPFAPENLDEIPANPLGSIADPLVAQQAERDAGMDLLVAQHEEEQSRLYQVANSLGLDATEIVNLDDSELGTLAELNDYQMAAYAAHLAQIPVENIARLIAPFLTKTAPAETAVPEPVASTDPGQETPSGQTTDAETALTDGKPGIKWDRNSKIGGTPSQAELDYFGFERNMKPAEFRNYVPEGVWNKDTKDFILGAASRGESVAPPFLKAEWDKDKKVWNVQNHEGRSRTDAALELNPDQDMPVSILPTLPQGELRARDITDEMRNAPIIGQIGSPSNPKVQAPIQPEPPKSTEPSAEAQSPEQFARAVFALEKTDPNKALDYAVRHFDSHYGDMTGVVSRLALPDDRSAPFQPALDHIHRMAMDEKSKHQRWAINALSRSRHAHLLKQPAPPLPEQAKIDEAAHTAATSDQNDLPQPTDAQKEAGNYKKGMVKVNGHDISIENPAGSQRDPKWPALANHYGYIKGTKGADKDHVDLFLTDKAADASLPVFVVDQMNADGSFDEHKVIMGAATEDEARAAYKSNYSKDFNGGGAITQMSQDEFKAWVYDANKTRKPAAETGPAADFMEVTDADGNTHRVRAKHLNNPQIDKIPTYDAKGVRIPKDLNRASLAEKTNDGDKSTAPIADGNGFRVGEKIKFDKVDWTVVEVNDKGFAKVTQNDPTYPISETYLYRNSKGKIYQVSSHPKLNSPDWAKGGEYSGPNSSDENAADVKPEAARKLTKDEISAEMDRVLAVMAENEDLAGKDLAGITEAVRTEADKALPSAKIDQLARKVMRAMKEKAATDAAPDPNVRVKALVEAFTAAPSGTNLDQFEAGFDHALARKTKSSLPEGDSYLAGYLAGGAFGKTKDGAKFVSKDNQKKMEGDAVFDLKRKMDKARASADKDGTSQEQAVLDVLKEGTSRTMLIPNEEVAGESYGREVAVRFIRNKLKTFTQYMEDASFYGPFMESKVSRSGKKVSDSLRMISGAKSGSDEAAIEYIEAGVFGTYDAATEIGTRAWEWVDNTEGRPLQDQSAQARLNHLVSQRYDRYVNTMRLINEAIKSAKTAPEVFAAFDALKAASIPMAGGFASTGQIWRGSNVPSRTEGAQWIIENDNYEFVGGRPMARPGLDKISRAGMPDTRGRRDVLATEFKTEFGFAGTDFGKWVTGMEGQDNINYTFDAFADLANLLSLPQAVIGSNSGMYFTIGKLGSGRHAAHFSKAHPVRDEYDNIIGSVPVINITKTKGDGTISHEWGHALDLLLFSGEWTQLRRRFLAEFRKKAPSEAEVESIVAKYLGGGWSITGKSAGVESARHMLMNFDHYYGGKNGARKKADKNPTGYYSGSMDADEGRSPKYWSNDAEMFTRAFEAYIFDKMQARGAENNFLVNGWVKDGEITKEKGYKGAIYPEGDERVAFNRMFDAMVSAMKMVDGRPHITQADFNTALAYIPTTKYYAGRSLIGRLLMPGVLEERYKKAMAEKQKQQDENSDLTKDREVAKLFTEDQLKDPASRRLAAAQLAERLMSGRKLNILDARKMISSTPVEPGTTYAKLIEETTELAVVIAARLMAANGHRANKTNAQIFAELVDLYNNQPSLNTRTSESMAGQMYSTPAPLAFAASFLAGVDARTTVLEPTAGNGMLLLEASPALSTVNEMDQVRFENLTQMTFRATQENAATSLFASKSVDIVIANPPFGKTAAQDRFNPQVPGGFPTQQIDHAISMAALDAMKDGGRAVLIVGSATGMSPEDLKTSYNSTSKRSFYSSLYQAYNVVTHLRIDGKLYSRQGASFPVDMIVIEGRGESQLPLPGVQVPETITSFDQLKEIIDGRSRVVPASIGAPVGVNGGNGGTRSNDDPGSVDTPPRVPSPKPAEQAPGAGSKQGDAAGGTGTADGPAVPVDSVRGGKPGGNERAPAEPASDNGRDGLADQSDAERGPGVPGRNDGVPGSGQPGVLGDDGGRKSGRLDKVTNKTDDNPVSADKANSALERLKAAAAAKKAALEASKPDNSLGMFSQPDEELGALDEDLRQDFIDLSLNAIHDGARKFSDFVIKMTEYGLDAFSQFFKALYKFVTGKNDYDDVDGADAVDKAETDAIVNQAWDAWERQDADARDAASLDSKKTQVEYFPGSKVKSTGSLVPAGISEAIHQSLEKLDKKVGGIDRYVGKSLGYLPAELGTYFSAEQVDAIALSIFAYEQGRGFIIGDQTGIGKGRVNAAMIRYALRNGMTPVFITEKPNLYTDMLRDLHDIGMSEELGLLTDKQKIVMTNADESYKYELTTGYDADGEPVSYEGTLRPKKGRAAIQAALADVKSGKTPNIVFSTYSQSSNAGWRRTALTDLMPNAYLIIDESHNAGGTENARPKPGAPMNRAQYFRSLVIAAKGTFFSSATYAKRPSVMDLYSTTNMMLAVDGDASKLADAISSGGIPMQQAVAFMLAKDGQYIRRERSFAGIKYETQRHAVDIEVADKIAGSLRDIYDFSLLRAAAIENLQQQISNIGGSVDKGDSIGVDGVDFSGVMHTVVKQSLLALKAKATVDYVVKRVKGEIVDENGNKNRPERVVVTVSSTMGSLIDEIRDERNLKPGDPVDLRMNDIYLRHLERQRIVKYKYPLNRKHEIPPHLVAKAYLNKDRDFWIVEVRLTDAQLGPVAVSKFNATLKQINGIDFGSDTPASPIDYMHRMFAEAGIKTDEITGRNHTVRYGEIVDGHRTATYETRSSSIKSRLKAIKNFNDGDTEVLIINQSGSTGLSLHASEKVKNRQPRHMVIAQAEDNIDTHMQLLGRINRTGQVEIPAYTQFLADIPAEMRPASILAKKMASLNANTTGGKKTAVQSEDTVDFMNEYGGIIAYEFLQDNPDILAMLGGAAAKIMPADDTGIDEGIIRKLTGRIALLPVKVQERVFSDLSERYATLIAMLDAQGINKLEARAIDFRARTVESLEITEGDPENDSEFAKASILETIMGQQAFKPLTLAEIGVQVGAFLNGSTPEELTASMRREAAEFAQKLIDRNSATFKVESGKTNDAGEIDALRTKANTLNAGIRLQESQMDANLGTGMMIGKTIEITDSKGGIIWGIMLGIKANPKAENKLALSNVEAVVALINGESRTINIPFSKLQNSSYRMELKPSIAWKDEVTGSDITIDPRELLSRMSHTREVKRYIATGNLLAAKAELKEGSIVRFTRADGTVDQGVLLPQTWMPEEFMRKRPILLNNEQRIEFMSGVQGAKYGNTLSEVRRIRLNPDRGDGRFAIVISVPSATKFGAMKDPALLEMLKDDYHGRPNFSTVGRGQPGEVKMVVRPDSMASDGGLRSITQTTFHELIKYLEKYGGPMVVTGAAQEAKAIRDRHKPVQQSQPTRRTKGRVSVAQAREELGQSANTANLTVLQSPEELPDRLKTEGYKTADGLYDGQTGSVYIVADNLRSAAQARIVLAHELIGHYGIEAVTGPELWKQLDATIAKMQQNPTFNRLFEEIERRYPGADRTTFVKETIAVMAEKGVRNSVMDRIAHAIRQFLRKLGFTMSLSDAEIRSFIPLVIREQLSKSERFVRQGIDKGIRSRTINVDGIERSTENSQGQRIAETNEQLRNFWRWFGDSDVVDAKGRPLVVYHGTDKDFDVFSKERRGYVTGAESAKNGFFFTNRLRTAKYYSRGDNSSVERSKKMGGNPHVEAVYLSIKNPRKHDFKGSFYREEKYNSVLVKALADGNDGAILENTFDSGGYGRIDSLMNGHVLPETIYVAFEDNQIKSATDNNGDYSESGNIRLSSDTPSKSWAYSPLARMVKDSALKTATADQWKKWIAANAGKMGVKSDEIEFSGINEWLDLQQGKVSKEDIGAYMAVGGVQVEEVIKGESEEIDEGMIADYIERYVADEASGIQNGRVVRYDNGDIDVMEGDDLIYSGAPSYVGEDMNLDPEDVGADTGMAKYSSYKIEGGTDYKELLLTLPHRKDKNGMFAVDGSNFKSSHWDESNVVVHIRFDTRKDVDGNDVLFINEIQSDWGQVGRKFGFITDDLIIDGKSADEWQNEAMRLFEALPESPSSEQTAAWTKASANAKTLRDKARSRGLKDGQQMPTAPFVRDTKAWVALAIKRMIRYAADNGIDRIAFSSGEQSINSSTGDNPTEDQKHGAQVFYNQLVPQVANEVLRKLGGGKVGVVAIPDPDGTGRTMEVDRGPAFGGVQTLKIDDEPAWQRKGFTITPAMRDKALAGEVPLFSQPAGVMTSPATLSKWLSNKLTDIKPQTLGLIPMNYLTDFAHKKVSAIQNYIDARYAMEQMRNTLHQKYDAVSQDWLALAAGDKRVAQELAELMHEATIASVDPEAGEATYMTEKPKHELWKELNARFMAMPPEARKVYVDARNSYTNQVLLLEDVLVENFDKAVGIQINRSERTLRKRLKEVNEDGALTATRREELLAEAEQAHVKRVKDASRNSRSRAANLRLRFEGMRVAAPYFPLARFGRYSIAVKQDGRIISFSKRETIAEANALGLEFERQGHEVTIWVDDDKNNLRDPADPMLIADIDEIVSGSMMDVDKKDSKELTAAKESHNAMLAQMRDAIYQRYLDSLPDLSMRKSFIHRKKTAGFSDDALRAFSSTLFHGSYQVARLRYGMEMGEYLDIAAEQAKEFDPVQGNILVNEMRKRHEWVMNPKGSAAAQVATTGAFAFYLGANPAHLFLNATQTAMIGIPVLGSKYGFGNTAKHLFDATKLFFNTGGDISKALSGDELRAFREFEKSGLLDKSQVHDLAGVGENGVEYSAVREKWMRRISWFFHQSEVFNREVTALAAYRLAREAKNADGTSKYGHNSAIKVSRKQTYEIHFDYSNANRPRFMQSDAMKILLVFRNYNINLLYRLFRDIHGSMFGETKESKAEARKQLGAMMGMYAMMAGVTGMPFYGLAMAIAGAFDDEDEPFGAEDQFKQGMAEFLGPEAARYVLGGVPGTALNVDLRERIGMPNLWFRSPDRELEGRDYYYYWMEQLLGANAGMAKSIIMGSSQVASGLKEMNGGDIQRGVETMLPAAIKSVAKAGRYAVEGQETNLDGDKIIETGPGAILARALGFTPQDLAIQYDRNNALKSADAKLIKRRTTLINRYGLAATAGDTEGARDAVKSIMEFNRANPGYSITRGGLDRSLRLKARNDALNANGIVLNRRMQGLQSEMEGEE